MKQTYRFADIPVRAVFQENYIKDQCRDYETGEKPAFTIEITPEDVALEEDDSGKGTFPYGYLESLVFYRKFCEQVVYHDIVLPCPWMDRHICLQHQVVPGNRHIPHCGVKYSANGQLW